MLPQTEDADHARRRPCPTLILGLGNILLRDEGVGVRVVEALQQRELPPDVELCNGGTAGLDLLDAIASRRKVVVIDAIDGPAEPGAVVSLRPADLAPRDDHGMSLHEVGLLETLRAAEQLNVAPQEVVIIGVKPREIDWGLTLSPEIARLVPEVVDLVLAGLTGGVCPSEDNPTRDLERAADQNRDSYGAANQNRPLHRPTQGVGGVKDHGAANQNGDSHGALNQNRDSHGAAGGGKRQPGKRGAQ